MCNGSTFPYPVRYFDILWITETKTEIRSDSPGQTGKVKGIDLAKASDANANVATALHPPTSGI
jgi:hypothetical protein